MDYLSRAIELAATHSRSGINGPFGAVIVKNNRIIGEGWNQVVELNDPTAHAEINAIKKACKHIQSPDLSGSILYTSCEPCPMCLAATFWANIRSVYYACDRKDANKIGFNDETIYKELQNDNPHKQIKLVQAQHEQGLNVFDDWLNNPKRVMY